MVRDNMHGGRRNRLEKSFPAETAKINEDKRDLLKKKLAQYEERLTKAAKEIPYIAPEIITVFGQYYDNLAKFATAKIFLEHGSASKDEVRAYVTNSAREHWEDVYSDVPGSAEKVLEDHAQIIEASVNNGWGVVSAYNEGRENLLRDSEPVK